MSHPFGAFTSKRHQPKPNIVFSIVGGRTVDGRKRDRQVEHLRVGRSVKWFRRTFWAAGSMLSPGLMLLRTEERVPPQLIARQAAAPVLGQAPEWRLHHSYTKRQSRFS